MPLMETLCENRYSQHEFRALRRRSAAQRKDELIMKLQMDKIVLSGERVKLQAELASWRNWYWHTEVQEKTNEWLHEAVHNKSGKNMEVIEETVHKKTGKEEVFGEVVQQQSGKKQRVRKETVHEKIVMKQKMLAESVDNKTEKKLDVLAEAVDNKIEKKLDVLAEAVHEKGRNRPQLLVDTVYGNINKKQENIEGELHKEMEKVLPVLKKYCANTASGGGDANSTRRIWRTKGVG